MNDRVTNYELAMRDLLRRRGVETPCESCGGLGARAYGSGSTWRGGAGTASIAYDVCDQCWGSGDAHRHWTDIRELETVRKAWEDEQCLRYFARRTGARLGCTRAHFEEIASILEREQRRRKTPFDADGRGFWWRCTLEVVASALRSLAGKS